VSWLARRLGGFLLASLEFICEIPYKFISLSNNKSILLTIVTIELSKHWLTCMLMLSNQMYFLTREASINDTNTVERP
jgi:hypothetical protein